MTSKQSELMRATLDKKFPKIQLLSLSLSPDSVLLTLFSASFVFHFRRRPASSVSKSVAALPLSGKEKLAKPPRRLSVPPKSIASPASRPLGTKTPISETRAKRSSTNEGKSDLSNVSKTSNRKKYDLISSASYWLSQIKLSESAAKHSISLGFFKLALESGSEVCYYTSPT